MDAEPLAVLVHTVRRREDGALADEHATAAKDAAGRADVAAVGIAVVEAQVDRRALVAKARVQ